MAEGMEGAAVVVMEGETTSGKQLAKFLMVEGMEGLAVLVMKGKTTSGKPLA
jgi:hypothetical protein